MKTCEMMVVKLRMMCLSLVLFPLLSLAQNPEIGNKLWYSGYLSKKISTRWSVEHFSLTAFDVQGHDFWFHQSLLGLNYRFNKLWSGHLSMTQSFYGNSPWWERRYTHIETGEKFAKFSGLNLAVIRSGKIGRYINHKEKLIAQFYFPSFEKYGLRFQLSSKISYRRSNLPLRIKPFVQAALFYYTGGQEFTYYTENLEAVDAGKPHGLHRSRIKYGFTFRPVKKVKKLAVSLYRMHNREFNMGFGNDLNILQPRNSGTGTKTALRFSNYDIWGLQVMLFL